MFENRKNPCDEIALMLIMFNYCRPTCTKSGKKTVDYSIYRQYYAIYGNQQIFVGLQNERFLELPLLGFFSFDPKGTNS